MTTQTPTAASTTSSLLSHPLTIPELLSGRPRAEAAAALRAALDGKTVVYVGLGTCGLASGGMDIWNRLEAMNQSGRIAVILKKTGCIGYCQNEVMVDIKKPGRPRVSFGNVTPERLETIVASYLEKDELPRDLVLGISESYPEGPDFAIPAEWSGIPRFKDLPFFRKQLRIVLRNCGNLDPDSLEEYLAAGGYQALAKALRMPRAQVIAEVTASGLRGRGGGGFPTGRKWEFAFRQESDQKYIVMNADEGDPGAFMDRSVLEGDPHRVIEGMAIGGYAIGATKGYIYVRAEYPLAIEKLTRAIDQCRRVGLLGKNILDSGVDFDLTLKMGAGAFVCGEETALIASIEGKRGMPRPRPPFPAVAGVFGKPTVINNVETFANVPDILWKGARWFSSIGTEKSKGTKVFALTGKVNLSGLIEVPMGISLREIIYDIGGGIPQGGQFKAAQIGGPSGGCLPASCLDTPIDYDSLINAGAMMGSGGLVVMDDKTCMVDVARYFINFTRAESCGKCIPCREGIARLQEMLDTIVQAPESEKGNMTLERFKSVIDLRHTCELIRDTAACGLGQTAPNPILSTLRYFKEEYEAHIHQKRCPAHSCPKLVEYVIRADKCVGCTVCARECPTRAISGKVKMKHVIDSQKCVKCGKCLTVCRFDAVAKE
jgi:NADH:ubiquinone oxidoreductase subunit F (NADH-binding)/(2Fe-2S) ferredoxin/ferredoxin